MMQGFWQPKPGCGHSWSWMWIFFCFVSGPGSDVRACNSVVDGVAVGDAGEAFAGASCAAYTPAGTYGGADVVVSAAVVAAAVVVVVVVDSMPCGVRPCHARTGNDRRKSSRLTC